MSLNITDRPASMLRRPPLLPLSLLLFHGAAPAQQVPEAPMQQVEIKGPGAAEVRRNDSVGRIVVGREELARYGDTTLSDALKRQPGVSISGGEIRMRGLGAGYTQILIDGDPAPSGFAVDTLSPDLVERIEILRSASADTSAQAVAGTINIVMRKASARGAGGNSRSLKLTAGQAQRRTSPAATLQWSGRSGITGYSLAATASQTRRQDDPSIDERIADAGGTTLRRFDGRDDSRLIKLSLAPRMERKAADGDTLAISGLFDLSRSRSSSRQLETTLLGQPTASPDATGRAAYDTWLAKSDLSWSRRLGDGRLSLKAGLEANRRLGDYLFRGIDAGGEPWFERAVTSSADERRASTSGKYVTPLGDGHDIALGWDAALTRRGETRLQQDRAPGESPYYTLDQDYTANVRRLALFAQDEWQLRPGLQAYLGLRWEGLDTRTEGRDFAGRAVRASVFSPIGQLVWKLPGRPRDQLRLALARTYKAPQPATLVPRRYTVNNDNGPANPDFEGNPTLRPELAWGLDAALESYFKGDAMASVSVYARRIRDVVLQRLYQDGASWVTTPSNNGGASVRGIEADLRLPLPAPAPRWPALELRANLGRNWSHVDALPGPDNRLAAQAPFTLNLGADARFAGDAHKLATGINLHVVGTNTARVAPSLVTVSGMVRELEAYAAWSAGGAQWRLTLPDLLRRSARDSQLYQDAALFEQRVVSTPRRAAVRLQVEMPI
jgi:outer membrane receptor for ferrienterochelin and colicins